MASQVSNDAFRVIFPQYQQLLSEETVAPNPSVELFLREQLPRKVQLVRNMQASFNAFLTHFTNIILKRPQHAHLIHALILKANDKIQKYFQTLSLNAHKMDSAQIKSRLPSTDPQALRKQFRSRLESMGDLLKDKYFAGGSLTRQCEQQVTMRLYVLFEIYHFLKGDPVALAGKYKIGQNDVLWSVSRNQTPSDLQTLINLDPNFALQIQQTVMKRCRPFINRRQLLESKVRQALREGESRVGPNLNLFLESLISKERGRVIRQLSSSLTRELRSLEEGDGQADVKDMISEVEQLKRQFAQIKNTSYFLDIMRGSFSEKYKMEIHKLENVFYLTNLEKYLQDVSTFLEKVLALEERVIANRKEYMRDFGTRVDIKISDLISVYEAKTNSVSLPEAIAQQFQLLESALYGVVTRQQTAVVHDDRKREDRERRDADRRRQMELKAEQDRQRREEQKARIQEKRQKEEERIRIARMQRQQKDRQRRQEQDRQQQIRRAELEKRRQQKSRKDEEQRRIRDQQARRREQERKIKEAEDRSKRESLARKKAEEDDRRRIQKQKQSKQKQEERKRILQREEEDKKRKEAELKERKQRQEQDRIRRQNDRKTEEQRIRRQKQQKQQEQWRRQEEQLQKEKQRKERDQRQADERKKQDETRRIQKEKKDREQRELEQKRRDQQRKNREKREQQEKERRQKERRDRQAEQKRLEEEKKREEERQRMEKEKRDRELKEQKQRERKAEEDRIAREREQKAKLEKQRKEKEERQRQELQKAERQRQQRQKQQRDRKQKERLEKQRLQKDRKEREQRERAEIERQQKQEEEKRKKAENERHEREKRQAEEKIRLEQERKDKERKEKQQKQRQAQLQRKKRQEEEKAKAKQQGKPETKKSSGIDYGDFDDILDDDLEQMEKAGKISPGKGSQAEIDDDYGDDFESPGKQGEQQIAAKGLIGPQDIKCLNDYMKGTSYARKNKVNAQSCNKADKYLEVFEEFIQNRKMFIFSSSISKAVLELGGQLSNPDTPEDDLHMSIDTIKEEMLRAYDQVLPGEEMFPATRYIYPFSFANEFNIKIIEMIPAHTYFRVIFSQPLPEDEEINQKFQSLVEGLLHVFQLQSEPTLEQSVISEESRMVLETFDRQLPCLLLLFAYHYETSSPKEIVINQYTIQRFFYSSNIILPLYDDIKEGQQIDQFYNNLFQKFSNHDKIKIHNVTVNSSDPEYSQQLTHSALAIKEQFIKSKHTTVLASFAIELEEEGEVADKVVLYMSIDRASPKPIVNYFLVNKDQEEEENARIIYELVGEGDDNFQVNVFTEFTRHNCLSSYSDWALPLWAHVITKRKLSSLAAMRAMAFAMTPFYLAFKEVD